EAVARGEYVEAQRQLDQARVALSATTTLLPPERVREASQIIANSQAGLDRARAEAREAEARARAEAVLLDQQEQGRLADEQREATVRVLIEDAQRLFARRDYRQASNVLGQILELDTTIEYAASVLAIVQDYSVIADQSRFEQQYRDQFELQLNQAR